MKKPSALRQKFSIVLLTAIILAATSVVFFNLLRPSEPKPPVDEPSSVAELLGTEEPTSIASTATSAQVSLSPDTRLWFERRNQGHANGLKNLNFESALFGNDKEDRLDQPDKALEFRRLQLNDENGQIPVDGH